MIRMAIEQNYCAYSALEHDPLLDKFRATPEFADLLKAALVRQESVVPQADQGQQCQTGPAEGLAAPFLATCGAGSATRCRAQMLNYSPRSFVMRPCWRRQVED